MKLSILLLITMLIVTMGCKNHGSKFERTSDGDIIIKKGQIFHICLDSDGVWWYSRTDGRCVADDRPLINQ